MQFIIRIKPGQEKRAEQECDMKLRKGQVYVRHLLAYDTYTSCKRVATRYATRDKAEAEALSYEKVIQV